jgi:hypothetical protein
MAVNEYQGARSYIDVIEILRDTALANNNINTFTVGDISEVDLDKQTIFPLAHTIVNSAQFNSTIITYNITVLFMDIVHSDSSENEPTIYSKDNENYVLNTMLNVGNHITDNFNSGDLNDGNTRIMRETVNAEPFKDRFENLVAGWAFTFEVETRNNINRCLT